MLKSPIMATDATTNAPAPTQSRNDKRATGFMLLAVAGYSVMPLAVVLFGAREFPFLFGGLWRGGIAIAYAVFLVLFFHKILLDRQIWQAVGNRLLHRRILPHWRILLATLANFDVALFAMATIFLHVPTAIILFVIPPLIRVFIKWVFKRDYDIDEGDRKVELNRSVIAFFLMGIFAVVFVVLSQAMNDETLQSVEWNRLESIVSNAEAQKFALGILLAVGAVIISSLNMFGIQWRFEVKSALPDAVTARHDDRSIDMFLAVFVALIASIAIIPLSGAAHPVWLGFADLFGLAVADLSSLLMDNGQLNLPLLTVFGAAALTYAVGGISMRKANSLSLNPGINGLEQLSPLLSLLVLWFVLPGEFMGTKADFLVMGTAAIIISNVLINFEGEVRVGFKALLIGLGTCGAIVYLRGGIYERLGIPDAAWETATGDYLGWIALAATIFTLLLAFRVATTVSRTSAEEAYAFSALRKMEILAERNVIGEPVLEQIAVMDSPENNSQLKEAYTQASAIIAQTPTPENDLDRELLVTAEAEIDTLARSKQLRLVLGELFALNIFAGLTIAFTLLLRPDIDGGLTALLNDLFAMLISAVVIFLAVHVWDLHHERAIKQLRKNEETGRYELQFRSVGQAVSDVWISVIAGVGIVVTYALLLASKHGILAPVLAAFEGWLSGPTP